VSDGTFHMDTHAMTLMVYPGQERGIHLVRIRPK